MQEIESVAQAAMSKLTNFFSEEAPEKNQISAARIASSVLSSYVRSRQIVATMERTNFVLARELAQNSQQLADYIRLTSPQNPVLKMLEKPTTE